jgi:hypothetical protein
MTYQNSNLDTINSLVEEVYLIGEAMSFEDQRQVFVSSMKNYLTFNQLISRDMGKLPPVLRLALISRAFYGEGSVECPPEFSEDLELLLESDATSWYDNPTVGYKVFNLRESLLQNPLIDVITLKDEFENSGDSGNLIAILKNPNCPDELFKQIQDRDHLIFDELDESELTDLIEVAERH